MECQRIAKAAQECCVASEKMDKHSPSLGGSAITMMQPADHRNRDHPPLLAWLDVSFIWRVAIQRQVSSRIVVIIDVRVEYSFQMSFVKNDDVPKALAFHGAYHSFGIWILPRRSWRANDFFNAHIRDSLLEEVAVDSAAIADQKPRCFLTWKGLDDLLCGPFGRRMRRHIEMHDPPPIVAQNDERE